MCQIGRLKLFCQIGRLKPFCQTGLNLFCQAGRLKVLCQIGRYPDHGLVAFYASASALSLVSSLNMVYLFVFIVHFK